MTEPHKVQCFARVARPYESVRECLHRLLVAGEPAPLGIHSILDQQDVAGLPASTRVTLAVEDVTGSETRHVDSAEIYASALSPFETKLEIECHCIAPPCTWADEKACSVAEAHVHAMLDNIVDRIQSEIDVSGGRATAAS